MDETKLIEEKCKRCKGKGTIRKGAPCKTCGGSGKFKRPPKPGENLK